jgi:integrase
VAIITVQQFIERYLRERVAKLSKGSRDTCESILRLHVIQAYGSKQLRDLDASDLQKLIDLKATRYSHETLKKIKTYSSGFFSYAQVLKLVDSNPAQLVKLPRHYEKKEGVTPLESEARKLRVALRDEPAFAPCYEMMILSACTSIHHSELAAFRWKRINLTAEVRTVDGKDLPGRSVSVMESFYRGEFGPPKNRKRIRIEAVPTEVVAALSALKTASQHTSPEDLVFCDGDGHPLAYDHTKLLLDKACGRAGIRILGWHSFRRYFATQSKRKGMDDGDRQLSMGHGSAMMTQHYTQEDLDRRRPAVEAIAGGLFEEPTITHSSPTEPSSKGC